jgi:micrococcal nuclease
MVNPVAVAAVALVLALAGAAPARAQSVTGPAYVTRVVDGETLYAEIAGRLEVVRYLGVNAPRIDHPTRGPEPYAALAREINRRLVEGKWIYLVFEREPRDRFGRLLAYVWVGDVFVNAMLIHRGFGEAATSTTPTPWGEYFRSLEAGARQDARGYWSDADARTYHRPRPAEGTLEASEIEERAADASGGRVFSAPAPFVPTYSPGPSAPSVGVPAAPVSPGPVYVGSSPSYIPSSPSNLPSRGGRLPRVGK